MTRALGWGGGGGKASGAGKWKGHTAPPPLSKPLAASPGGGGHSPPPCAPPWESSLAPRPAPRGGPRIIRRRPASLSRAPPSLPLLQAAAAACLPVSGGGRGGGERCPVSQCESSHATTPPSPISVHACTRSEDTRDGKFARKEGEGGHDPDTSEGVESTSRRWLTSGPPCTPLAADHYSPTKPSKGEAL